MNAIKIHKQIDSGDIHVDGLEQYIGKSAEIIILIDDAMPGNDIINRNTAFAIIDSFSGEVEKWNRDDLYNR